ncbi:MAG: guanylate kinase [Syntrophomonadaceae bacterium]|nr:guanylate kinase [Syntrophomonadaceae bacterium]
MTREGILLIISGPSGVGKGTLCAALQKDMPELSFSISATTRSPRPGEVHGKNYFFYSRSEFEAMIKRDEFLEWAVVYDNLYGTPRQYVMDVLSQGKDIVLEIDTQGARQIKKRFPQGVFVFIVPPSRDELANRLAQRGTDSKEEIERRLNLAGQELENAADYDYIVPNADLEEAVQMLKAILVAERCRAARNRVAIPGF